MPVGNLTVPNKCRLGVNIYGSVVPVSAGNLTVPYRNSDLALCTSTGTLCNPTGHTKLCVFRYDIISRTGTGEMPDSAEPKASTGTGALKRRV